MDNTDTRAGYKARLVSPYINTTGKCLELFYWMGEPPSDNIKNSLSVIVISEEHEEIKWHSVRDVSDDFPRLYLQLPDGTQRIAIEGQRSYKRQFSALALDDVTIMDCDRFGNMNKVHFRNVTTTDEQGNKIIK